MRSRDSRKRRILLVYPRFARNNLLNYENMAPFYPGKGAVMPPLGLLLFAARLGDGWNVRLIDENLRPLAPADLAWSEVVALSGMHPQRRRITQILDEANRLGKITVLGGPSVNICPEYYPTADALHVGEMGDATGRLLEWLRAVRTKPAAQCVFRTRDKTPLDDQPLPRLDVIDVNAYLVQPIQFSVGCPFTCEFCDIPMIYGRVARIKSPARVACELQAIYDAGFVGTILFVDDNLVANRRALRQLLPEIIAWQKARGYPYPLTGEASINLARDQEVLRLLHEARFTHLFVGVESPDPATLRAISKKQNVMDPLVESLRALEAHGLEVIMGMIFGFDSDTAASGRSMVEFIGAVNAPIIYFNLLAALPKTPLWDRMSKEGRLLEDEAGDSRQSEGLLSCLTSNIQFKLGNARVEQMLRDTVRAVYTPAEVYRRFRWNAEHVYGKQLQGLPPARNGKERIFLLKFTLGTLARVLWAIGCKAPYRRHFWRYLGMLLRLRAQGKIAGVLEVLLRTAPNAHHLIEWQRTLLADSVPREDPFRFGEHGLFAAGRSGPEQDGSNLRPAS